MANDLLLGGAGLGLIAGFAAIFFIILAAFYVYGALVLMAIAKKTKTEHPWLAWIPIANIYLMTQIAGLHGLWTLAIFGAMIPVVGGLGFAAITVWWWWLIAEKVNKPGWWGLLMLIPIVNWVVMGIMAWGE